MKTKIKRHSRAVISVILAISMLVSCMMVGIIATDAAKVTDGSLGDTNYYVHGGNTDNNSDTWADTGILIGTEGATVSVTADTYYSFGINTSSTNKNETLNINVSNIVCKPASAFTNSAESVRMGTRYGIKFRPAVSGSFNIKYSNGIVTITGPNSEEEDEDDTENDWFLYGNQFGGFTFTASTAKEITKLTKDEATGLFYHDHTLESGNSYFSFYTTNGTKHFKPTSGSNTSITNNGVKQTAKEGWTNSNYYFTGISVGTAIRIWWDATNKQVWVTPQSSTVTAGTVQNGSVTVDGGSSKSGIGYGGTVTLVATPSAGYEFSNWEANTNLEYANDKSATTIATVSGNATVTAVFKKIKYTVTLTDGGTQYTLSSNKDAQVDWGESVTVTATPKGIYKISGINVTQTEGGASVQSGLFDTTGVQTLTFTMPQADVTVTATPVQQAAKTVTYGITTDSPANSGYVSVGEQYNENVNQMKHTIANGAQVLETTVVNFNARPAVGYKFVGWYNAPSGGTKVQNNADFHATASSNLTYYAKFELATDPAVKTTTGVRLLFEKSAFKDTDYMIYAWNHNNNDEKLTGNWGGTKVKSLNDGATVKNGTEAKEYYYYDTTLTNFKFIMNNNGNDDKKTGDMEVSCTANTANTLVVNYANNGGTYDDRVSSYSPVTGGATDAWFPVIYNVPNPLEGDSDVHSAMFAEDGASVTFYHTPADTTTKKVQRTSVGFNEPNYNNNKTKDETTTMTMPSSYPAGGITFTAEFIEKDKYAVNFSANDPLKGTVTAEVDSVAISSGDLVYEDKDVVFTATPETGYFLDEWTGDASGDESPATVTVGSTAVNVVGNFVNDAYSIITSDGKTRMKKIADGIYIARATLNNKKFKIYNDTNSNASKSTTSAGQSLVKDNRYNVSGWEEKTDFTDLDTDDTYSFKTPASNVYVVYDEANNQVYVLSSNNTHTLTLANLDNGNATIRYGNASISEGESLTVLDNDTVSLNITPDKRYVVNTVSATGSATVDPNTGMSKTRTVKMATADSTVTVALRAADTKRVYFDNYYTKYSMVSAYAWNGNPDETNRTEEPLGVWGGSTMTKIANTDTWYVELSEDIPYIIFRGEGANTRTAENNYYHITIPWGNGTPMYIAGKHQNDPTGVSTAVTTDDGTWSTYSERSNVYTITNVVKGDADNNDTLFTGINATLYDYYVDNEITGGWRTGISTTTKTDYSVGNGNNYTWNPYRELNHALSFYAKNGENINGQFGVARPLYFGNLNTTNDGDVSQDGTEKDTLDGLATHADYTNWDFAANNSVGLGNGNASKAVQGLSGKTLDGSNIHYYSSANATTENGVYMAMFDEDFLSGQNDRKKTLATILRSPKFPVRQTTKDGQTYYTFDSTDGNDNVYITDVNSATKTAQMKYYGVDDDMKVHAAKVGDDNGDVGFFPFDYDQAGEDKGDLAHDLGFGMKLEIPFTLESGGMLDGHAQTFDFSGDDDLWVFIDDQLVLDLGGAHTKTKGSINFADKTVTTTPTAVNATGFSGTRNSSFDWFDNTHPNAVHTMTIYYMERGMYDSNLKFGFSMHPIPNMLMVDKKVRTYDVNSGFFRATDANQAVNAATGETYKNSRGATITEFEHTYQQNYTEHMAAGKVPDVFTINQSSAEAPSGNPFTYSIDSGNGITPTLGENYSFQYNLYNDNVANFVGQYSGGKQITLSETIPNGTLYNYTPRFLYTDVANHTPSGEETPLDYDDDEPGEYTIVMPAEDPNAPLQDIRVRARFENHMKTHDLILVKNVNDFNPDAEFTFKVMFKFGNYDYEPYKLDCVVDGANVTMGEDGTVPVKHGHQVYIKGVPENAQIMVQEIIDSGSDYAFSEMNVNDQSGAVATGTLAGYTYAKTFTMGTSDITATVRNTKSELNITHDLKSDSTVNGTCYVWAEVLNNNDTVALQIENENNTDPISVPSNYVKASNETNKLKIYLKTVADEDVSVCDFYEQIFESLNKFTSSDDLGLDATVAITPVSARTATATITFQINKLFDSVSKAQRASTLPFFSKLGNLYAHTKVLYSPDRVVSYGLDSAIGQYGADTVLNAFTRDYYQANDVDWTATGYDKTDTESLYTHSNAYMTDNSSNVTEVQYSPGSTITLNAVGGRHILDNGTNGSMYSFVGWFVQKGENISKLNNDYTTASNSYTVDASADEDLVFIAVFEPQIDYVIKYTYTSTHYGSQSYQVTGTFTPAEVDQYLVWQDDSQSAEYLDGTYVYNTSTKQEFFASKSPFEKNIGKSFTWKFGRDSSNYYKANHQMSGTVPSQDGDDTIRKVQFQFPYRVQNTNTGTISQKTNGKVVRVDIPTEGHYKDGNYSRYLSVNAAYGSPYTLNWEETGAASNYITAEEKIFDTNNKEYHFAYWSIKNVPVNVKETTSDPTTSDVGSDTLYKQVEVARCYNLEFNFTIYQDYIVVPVYQESNAPIAKVHANSATITFTDEGRNQWNANGGGTTVPNGGAGTDSYDANKDQRIQGDKIFLNFMTAYDRNDMTMLNTATNSGIKVGVLFERLDALNADEKENVPSQAELFNSYGAKDSNHGVNNAKAQLTASNMKNLSSTLGKNQYALSEISLSNLDNKNRISYEKGVTHKNNKGAETGYANYIYRAYAYMIEVDGSITISEQPVYFTFYTIANMADGSSEVEKEA